ncbi:MAG: hypothetical protein BGO14_00525 [Chlamydiales bacterium 38-26]|nr:MAG: hypothetical protein BGO14_00525 [Chlamydiales bacterium 38-26]
MQKRLKSFLLASVFFLTLLVGCSYRPTHSVYHSFYRHLELASPQDAQFQEDDYFLVILVEARHLDYSCSRSLFKSLAKHPSDGSKNGDVGHAWIYLEGWMQGRRVVLEGGHSGELGVLQPRYIEGVFMGYEKGTANPISYLWNTQKDGFFQWGSGRHYPTFAAKVSITGQQFKKILKFIELYDYSSYAITGNQCCTFATQIAAFAGLSLDCELTIPIQKFLRIGSHRISLWKDPLYSQITISSPDALEKSLIEAVHKGEAAYALDWYKRTHQKPGVSYRDLLLFPQRYWRFKTI